MGPMDEGPDAFNQPPPFGDVNLAALDTALMDALADDPKGKAALLAFGAEQGSRDQFALGRLANENPPVLRAYDPQGRRSDFVEFHPAYHALMAGSVAAGIHCSTWEALRQTPRGGNGAPRSPATVARIRAAHLYVVSQVEAGHVCPLTMTHAAPAALAASPSLFKEFLPRIASRAYDGRFLPFWEKAGVTLGMGMTERQGGTDVRTNTTSAAPIGGDEYEITGHKWFFSAPMSDAFLVLAQAPGGLTCFLMPRFRPDGQVNAIHLQRLKPKLGNRSNASCEVEFARAFAWRVGEEGRGIATILEMVQLTRLDCALSSAALMRMALAQAVHHARHRTVFQKKLVDHPAMGEVLADLALEAEGWTALALLLAESFGELASATSAQARFLTPAAKFTVCKAAPNFVYEAMEVLGGNGYVEENPMPRLYREAPVNAIWEGSGTVVALDLVRAAGRAPDDLAVLLDDLRAATSGLPGAEDTASEVARCLTEGSREANARRAAERLAALAAAAALAKRAPAEVAEAFARTRLAATRRMVGTNDLSDVRDLLLTRALPEARTQRVSAMGAGHH